MSPYEADAQITFLLNNGYADMVITEDSDLLAYGCKEVCTVHFIVISLGQTVVD
jgi:exonuclease-1